MKRYAEIGDTIRMALESYAADVRERRFPREEHTYAMPADELEIFEGALRSSEGDREHGHDRRE